MKILLIAYVKGNLGDDLFIREIIERYSDVDFYLNTVKEEYVKPFEKYENFHVNLGKRDLKKVDISFYDAFVYVGGSIFVEFVPQSMERIESFKEFVIKCKNNGKPFFYMSANFGPYSSEEYYNAAKELFENCEDICYRDRYSANLFKGVKSVRYAPDLVFSLKFPKKEIEKDTVGITMLDVTRVKGLEHKENDYYMLFENNIKRYVEEGKKVYLFSFWLEGRRGRCY